LNYRIAIKHFFAIFKVSRPETFETDTETRPEHSRPRLAKMGLETSLETETKSRDSITGLYRSKCVACLLKPSSVLYFKSHKKTKLFPELLIFLRFQKFWKRLYP